VVVDKNAEEHCVTPIADAFVKYLHTPDAQEVFQSVATSARSTSPRRRGSDGYPPVTTCSPPTISAVGTRS
jgi:ABC-type sulfate transport system substrate-binding protein